MPLPDATKDKRIYQLLKNIDLGNLTFSEFQTAAQSVFAEPEAEDTLRRIVLVNLARMSVAGDWSGLTTAAAAGETNLPFSPVLSNLSALPASNGLNLPGYMIAGDASKLNSNNWGGTGTTAVTWYPFYSYSGGTLEEIQLRVSTGTAADLKVALYDTSDTTGEPNNLLQENNFGNTANNTSYTWTAQQTVTANKFYWFAMMGMASKPTINFYPDTSVVGQVGQVSTAASYSTIRNVGLYQTGLSAGVFPDPPTSGSFIAVSSYDGIPAMGFWFI